MKQIYLSLATLVLALSPAFAQKEQTHPRVSPSATVDATIDGDALKIVYSRPFTKDPKTGAPRKIWGELVPFGKVWRTGANEATLLTTATAIELGGTTVPAGTYSLFTIPEENGGKLIVNKQTGQSGLAYDEKQDLTRVDLKKEASSKSPDQFLIAIEKGASGGGMLKFTWADAEYSVPFTVKK
jgi:hypothetical protein